MFYWFQFKNEVRKALCVFWSGRALNDPKSKLTSLSETEYLFVCKSEKECYRHGQTHMVASLGLAVSMVAYFS